MNNKVGPESIKMYDPKTHNFEEKTAELIENDWYLDIYNADFNKQQSVLAIGKMILKRLKDFSDSEGSERFKLLILEFSKIIVEKQSPRKLNYVETFKKVKELLKKIPEFSERQSKIIEKSEKWTLNSLEKYDFLSPFFFNRLDPFQDFIAHLLWFYALTVEAANVPAEERKRQDVLEDNKVIANHFVFNVIQNLAMPIEDPFLSESEFGKFARKVCDHSQKKYQELYSQYVDQTKEWVGTTDTKKKQRFENADISAMPGAKSFIDSTSQHIWEEIYKLINREPEDFFNKFNEDLSGLNLLPQFLSRDYTQVTKLLGDIPMHRFIQNKGNISSFHKLIALVRTEKIRKEYTDLLKKISQREPDDKHEFWTIAQKGEGWADELNLVVQKKTTKASKNRLSYHELKRLPMIFFKVLAKLDGRSSIVEVIDDLLLAYKNKNHISSVGTEENDRFDKFENLIFQMKMFGQNLSKEELKKFDELWPEWFEKTSIANEKSSNSVMELLKDYIANDFDSFVEYVNSFSYTGIERKKKNGDKENDDKFTYSAISSAWVAKNSEENKKKQDQNNKFHNLITLLKGTFVPLSSVFQDNSLTDADGSKNPPSRLIRVPGSLNISSNLDFLALFNDVIDRINKNYFDLDDTLRNSGIPVIYRLNDGVTYRAQEDNSFYKLNYSPTLKKASIVFYDTLKLSSKESESSKNSALSNRNKSKKKNTKGNSDKENKEVEKQIISQDNMNIPVWEVTIQQWNDGAMLVYEGEPEVLKKLKKVILTVLEACSADLNELIGAELTQIQKEMVADILIKYVWNHVQKHLKTSLLSDKTVRRNGHVIHQAMLLNELQADYVDLPQIPWRDKVKIDLWPQKMYLKPNNVFEQSDIDNYDIIEEIYLSSRAKCFASSLHKVQGKMKKKIESHWETELAFFIETEWLSTQSWLQKELQVLLDCTDGESFDENSSNLIIDLKWLRDLQETKEVSEFKSELQNTILLLKALKGFATETEVSQLESSITLDYLSGIEGILCEVDESLECTYLYWSFLKELTEKGLDQKKPFKKCIENNIKKYAKVLSEGYKLIEKYTLDHKSSDLNGAESQLWASGKIDWNFKFAKMLFYKMGFWWEYFDTKAVEDFYKHDKPDNFPRSQFARRFLEKDSNIVKMMEEIVLFVSKT